MSDQPIRKPFAKLLNWSGGRINLKKPADVQVKPAAAQPQAQSFVEVAIENPLAGLSVAKRKAEPSKLDVDERAKKVKEEEDQSPAASSIALPPSLLSLPPALSQTAEERTIGVLRGLEDPADRPRSDVDAIRSELSALRDELEAKSNYIRKINRDYLALQYRNETLEDELKKEAKQREQVTAYSTQLKILYDSALAGMEADEAKHRTEIELAKKERLNLQVEVTTVHHECATLREQLAEERQDHARLQDEVDALRFSNEMVVQMHAEQRGTYNQKLQEVYAEKTEAEQQHQNDDVKWSELLQDSEKMQKQLMEVLQQSVQKIARLETENAELRKKLDKGS